MKLPLLLLEVESKIQIDLQLKIKMIFNSRWSSSCQFHCKCVHCQWQWQ